MYYIEHTIQDIKAPDGNLELTLVEAVSDENLDKAVLYVHGHNDYFFHHHVAEFYVEQGFAFYAIDLRRNGRSLREGQVKGDLYSMAEYIQDIELSLRKIKQSNVLLQGHSMGGLAVLASLENDFVKSKVHHVVLNSPFLAYNVPAEMMPEYRAKMLEYFHKDPDLHLPSDGPGTYGKSLHREFWGEWDFNLLWKQIHDRSVSIRWLKAILDYHDDMITRTIVSGVKVLFMTSSKSSVSPDTEAPELFNSDVVLNVNQLREVMQKIDNGEVSYVQIENGIHDLFLGKKPSRDLAFKELYNWLKNNSVI